MKFTPINLIAVSASALAFIGSVGAQDDVAPQPATERSLQDLFARWNIQEPTFNYTSLQFSLNWKVSDFIEDRFMDYRVYDGFGCKDDSNDVTAESNDIHNGTVYLRTHGLIPSALTPHNPGPTSGGGERSVHLRLSIESENIAGSPIYTEDLSQSQARAEVRFCVRYSLWNEHPSVPDAVEVNFQETLVYFEVDLTDGFEVGEFQVADKEKGLETANVACEVIGYECFENRTAIPNPGFLRNQGSETRICVTTTPESKANGLYLNRINWFYFYRVNPDGTIRQNAIIYDSVAAPNGLTDYSCVPGEDPCPFDTILFANFYDRAGVGIVLGEGEATCQYGTSGFTLDSTDAPGSAPPQTAEPAATDSPVTPAPVATPDPTPVPTPTPTPAPEFAPVEAYPTPAPCLHIFCPPSTCGTEAIVFSAEPSVSPLPSGTVVIDNQAEDATSVTFTLTQLWSESSVSYISFMYPDFPEGNNVCPKYQSVAYGESFQHTATCFQATTSDIRVFIEVFVDATGGEDPYVPEDCQPAQNQGSKLAYEIFIPCQPCSRRLSTENAVLSTPLNMLGAGAETTSAKMEDESLESAVAPKKKASSLHIDRLAKSLMTRNRQRKLQEEELPPSPFELEFSIFSDGRAASSAPNTQSRFVGMLMFAFSASLLFVL